MKMTCRNVINVESSYQEVNSQLLIVFDTLICLFYYLIFFLLMDFLRKIFQVYQLPNTSFSIRSWRKLKKSSTYIARESGF